MRLDCPSCAASYDVPDAKLAGRKTVRCARCGHQWAPSQASAPGATPATPRSPASWPNPDWPDPDWADRGRARTAAGPSRLAPPAAPRPGRLGLRLAWAATGLVLAIGLAAAFVWRTEIVRAWPPSLRVYAALGLAHNAR